MSFAKLDSGIVNSTLWVQPDDVLRVWIWMLSQADADGVVRVAAPALANELHEVGRSDSRNSDLVGVARS